MVFQFALVCHRCCKRHAAEAVDALHPILSKLRIDNSVTTRGMIEAMLVSNHANVFQTTEEYEGAKLELLFHRRLLEAHKEVASARSFKIDSARLEDAPHES